MEGRDPELAHHFEPLAGVGLDLQEHREVPGVNVLDAEQPGLSFEVRLD
jgi:hypothetical protein